MNHFSAKTGHKKLHAVIGGTHLGFMMGSGQQLKKSMDVFDDYMQWTSLPSPTVPDRKLRLYAATDSRAGSPLPVLAGTKCYR
ncbi:MAG: hypothetical protein HF982_02310 [Desulfobacteraceae bacterium]|nr:hypothetical protein [Desulfobacteraceae bacterium]MBC2718423.1 hypothetical protein [Desulfobacteraceae bacterium]